MSDRTWEIGVCGTFDVENYGDLLFPFIAEAELGERLGSVRLHRFSYRAKSADPWPFEVTSVSELPRLAGSLDGLLVGGGFLIRFDKEVAPGYGPPGGIHHPTGYWLSPALIALQQSIPLIWNAPGMDRNEIPSWAEPLVELAFSLSSYAAVRDEPSHEALARFAGAGRLAVIPDTAFGIDRLLTDALRFDADRLRDAVGLSRPYVVVQASVLPTFERFLRRHGSRMQQWRVLVLPIAPELGDDLPLSAPELPGLVRLPVWPRPLQLAELIRGADGFVGHSLHPVITALACGVPVFTLVELPGGKYSALAGFDTIFHLTAEHEADGDWFLSRLGRKAPTPPACAARERLVAHWDRVADVVRGGRTETASAVGRFWQSLPGLLEGAAVHHDAAARALRSHAEASERERCEREELQRQVALRDGQVAALESELSAQRARIAELSRLVGLARSEIVRRDDRIAGLLDSTSWRVTSPFRLIGRRLGR